MSALRWHENKSRTHGFSHNALVIIGMIAMLLDHIAFVLIKNGKLYGYDATLYNNAVMLPEAKMWLVLYQILRTIGRIAFPIFALLIVEGYRKTSNVFKYMMRILLLAIISEIPFDLMIFNEFLTKDCFNTQNVLFTYFVGLLMLVVINWMNKWPAFLTIIPLVIAEVICYFLKTDYWAEGILLIYVFYMFRHDLNLKCIIAGIILFVMSFEYYKGAAIISLFFIYLYNGQKGYLNLKRIHYVFFPLHMLVLYAILFFTYLSK